MTNALPKAQQEMPAARECSARSCANCFANRGCMYELHPASKAGNTTKLNEPSNEPELLVGKRA
jgi:hypothetical protein